MIDPRSFSVALLPQVLALANLGGRIGWAAFSDKFGRRLTFHLVRLTHGQTSRREFAWHGCSHASTNVGCSGVSPSPPTRLHVRAR